MSEEQQAVLDEGQANDVIENQGIDDQQTEALDTQAESAPAEDAKPELTNAEKRINKITAEKYAEKRQRLALEDKLKELENKQANPVTPQDKPTLEQFDFDENQYQEALIDYKVSQKMVEASKAAQRNQSEVIARQRSEAFDSAEAKYAETNPDYIDSVQQLPQFKLETLDTIRSQDNGPQLVHHLSKNLELADKIASLDPYSAAVQVGIISERLSATGKTEIKTSTAPEPIDPINTGGAAISDNMSAHAKGATFE
jgi:hypothetical protein